MRNPIKIIKDKYKDYKLRHLQLGKIKMLDKEYNNNFEIVDIDWEISWKTNIYLTVIIRDYLRHFINNAPIIGNCVIEDKSPLYQATEEDLKRWNNFVNSVADEFDELICLHNEIDTSKDDITELHEKEKQLTQKAFSDLAFIYDDLWW